MKVSKLSKSILYLCKKFSDCKISLKETMTEVNRMHSENVNGTGQPVCCIK